MIDFLLNRSRKLILFIAAVLFVGGFYCLFAVKPTGAASQEQLDYILGRSEPQGSDFYDADANRDFEVTIADLQAAPEVITIMLPGNVPLEMVRISSGTFTMGSPDAERSRLQNEGPQHQVTIAEDFYIGKFEVTQAQWDAIAGWNDFQMDMGFGPDFPAHNVSWFDIMGPSGFIEKLNVYLDESGESSVPYRMPSEAEWEYACRAGTTTRFYFGDSLGCLDASENCAAGVLPGTRDDYMNYGFNINIPAFGGKKVGSKIPNQFGLYDMHGNVWEWVADPWHETFDGAPTDGRVWSSQHPMGYTTIRSGGWGSEAWETRTARRGGGDPTHRSTGSGFRLARSLTGFHGRPTAASPVWLRHER